MSCWREGEGDGEFEAESIEDCNEQCVMIESIRRSYDGERASGSVGSGQWKSIEGQVNQLQCAIVDNMAAREIECK